MGAVECEGTPETDVRISEPVTSPSTTHSTENKSHPPTLFRNTIPCHVFVDDIVTHILIHAFAVFVTYGIYLILLKILLDILL